MEPPVRSAFDSLAFGHVLSTLMMGQCVPLSRRMLLHTASRREACAAPPSLVVAEAVLNAQYLAFVHIFHAYWRYLDRAGASDDAVTRAFLIKGMLWVAVEKGRAKLSNEALSDLWRDGYPIVVEQAGAFPHAHLLRDLYDDLALEASLVRFRRVMANYGVAVPSEFEEWMRCPTTNGSRWWSKAQTTFRANLRRDARLRDAWDRLISQRMPEETPKRP